MKLSLAELKGLPPVSLAQVEHYIYLDRASGKYVVCMDDARFYNHSAEPNTGVDPETPDPELDVALRDIEKDEELLCDYRSFTDDLGF